ncbi:MAG TPA: PEP/pyruvate-binding domain-containing protein, partial [Caulobacteraceae bacterium]|nr:PEP/pyruvate-binding domain-containing protein [Caulobacteraceae bacterium]
MVETLDRARFVYAFGGGSADGDASMKDLLGGKGANLAEMSSLGLPVPPGFTITTEACTHFYGNGRSYPHSLRGEVAGALSRVETLAGKTFGDAGNPLLVSVRSGARASMPGMMDTVLNLGLNDQTVEGLAKLAGDRRFAFDSYRRFIQMYSNVVLGLDHHMFEEILDDHKDALGFSIDTQLTAEHWVAIVGDYKGVVERELSRPFPQAPEEQLWGAIGAVFDSWMNDRAKFYRRMHDIPESWGTAVNVQSMVFGNMGETSATGVAFTRNPSTGEAALGHSFPQDPHDQLWGAIGAVFASWMNDRAKFYRRMHDIPESWGTAVNVQSMVFGNMGDTSATGVAFTRNPSTGEDRLYGEFLINAQGEDVVAGIRTPQALTRAAREEMGENAPSMEEAMPAVFAEFKSVVE